MNTKILEGLFESFYNEAILYTVSLCKDKALAEDIVSTAFYKALVMSDTEIRNFKLWLLTVCRNEFFSICRKNKALSFDELPEELEDGSEEIVDKLIVKEEYRALYKALHQLNASQKEVILLFYFSGLPIRDIASVTGKSEANVKVLLYRGREKLKELMRIAE